MRRVNGLSQMSRLVKLVASPFVKAGLVFLTMTSGIAEGANLSAPFDVEGTAVLPANIRSPRFKNLIMNIDSKFDNVGGVAPLGKALNKTLSWNDLVDAQTEQTDKNLIAGAVGNLGYNMSDSPGDTLGEVKTQVNVMVPVMSMGITDKWTAALAVPIYRVDIAAATGFSKSGQGQSWANYLCGPSMLKCNEASEKLQDPINQKLRRLGYKEIKTETFSAPGDAKLIGKYQFKKTDQDSWAVKPALTIPTGRRPDVDKALDIPTGDGQWDLGATLVYERPLPKRWSVNAYTSYNIQLPDMIERRLPKSETDTLSEDKEWLYRDSGDQFALGVGTVYGTPSRGFTVGMNLSYQFMNSTSYHGTQYAADRYKWLEAQVPLQDMYAAMLALNYSTIDYFKEKSFAVPLQGGFTWSRPLAGRNVTTNDVFAAELVMFF